MLTAVGASLIVAVVAGFVYVRREQLGFEGCLLAVLRSVAVGSLVLLLVNPAEARRQTAGEVVVLLDASLSMAAPGGMWEAAVDTAMAIAGAAGTIYRFGTDIVPFHAGRPSDGASRLSEALGTAIAFGGPVHVVTDGELEDVGMLTKEFLRTVRVVSLPRDTVADVALLDVDVPTIVQQGDSVSVTLTIGIWGSAIGPSASLDVSADGRRILSRQLQLPPSPGVARRRITFLTSLLSTGTHTLRFRLRSVGDSVPADDERIRIISVSDVPSVAVLMDPPDWEGRFLVSELKDISGTTVNAYARLHADTWINVGTASGVTAQVVRRDADAAALLVVRGEVEWLALGNARQPSWIWPTIDSEVQGLGNRDWYLSEIVPPSPLAGRLALVEWDSVPPLQGLIPGQPYAGDWGAMDAQQGRHGASLPVVLGSESSGVRSLVSVGSGWWRWRMRGGAAREAYRAVLSAGVEWLFESSSVRDGAPLELSPVVERGEPILARWVAGEAPDSVAIVFRADGEEQEQVLGAQFDADGVARLQLAPGTYTWSAPDLRGAGGVTSVEDYSDEYHPRSVASIVGGGSAGGTLFERYARDNWWLFLIVVATLTAEWAWRHRKGLS